jgi:hypothetical protein
VGERSSGGLAHAVRDGIARAVSAPVILAGALSLTFVVGQLQIPGPLAAGQQYTAPWLLSPFGGTHYVRQEEGLAWLLIWSFLGGGILDRLARNRPTRGRGFFGACGAHFPAMLRLGLVEWLIWLAAARVDLERYPDYLPIIVGLVAGVVILHARVRLVVEDRRSAVGALLAGGRFIRRNPGAVAIFLAFAAAMWISMQPWGGLVRDLASGSRWAFLEIQLLVTLFLFEVLASWASAIAFFQSRLAHASYTAGPPLVWPESPAAEAITNLSPSARS